MARRDGAHDVYSVFKPLEFVLRLNSMAVKCVFNGP